MNIMKAINRINGINKFKKILPSVERIDGFAELDYEIIISRFLCTYLQDATLQNDNTH